MIDIKISKKTKVNKKSKKNSNENRWVNVRLVVTGIIATIGFLVVISHLAIIQFVEQKKWSQRAYNQQVNAQILSPNRGTIYDSKGEILAQSIAVDTISLNPGKITYSNNNDVPDEVVAEGISSIFNMTYEEVLKELNSDKSVVVVEKKVEKDKVDKLKEWMQENKISAGINIDEDSKRYYPYNDLASNLIGFCGTDNTGQVGIEERWNDVLTGTAGKVVTVTDVNDNAISDEDEQYVPSENGSNLYLTIDANIQGIAEKYLDQAMLEHPTAHSGNVIIMNPQTGDILAMATNPDYNLNDPSNYINAGFTEEEWKLLEPVARTETLLNLWKNKAVSGTYEPGSTFKLITASVGLEEGIVEPDTQNDFLCEGRYKVAEDHGEPVYISCWRDNPHGPLSLRGALCNSCNPAFMQLGERIGKDLLYKYYKAFGLFEPVGNDIAKAYKGIFTELDKVGPVELATASFGQRFEISPLQLITAVSAICNDGVLVEPKIVKQIENTDTGSIEVVETKKVRQVISKETADTVKGMMQSVVEEGTGRNAKVEGYSIGGKSGTSEPRDGKEDEGYVASFIAISPIENTQVVVLIALYGVQEDSEHQGGAVAGPVAGQILKEVLPYLGITANTTNSETTSENTDELKILQDVKNLTVFEAMQQLKNSGFEVITNTNADINSILVTDQLPKPGTMLREGSVISLYTAQDEERAKVQVPNVKDMTVAEAINSLKSKNLNVNVDGTSGVVVSQEPTYGTEVDEGSVVNIVVKEKLVDAQ
ncbi:MAG TPA: PASTA domain-containing protein [Candidatus Scatovivens faecipullorum]|nr:PASTA domain-containing protein [Candidatus Scatovivens faecipullorum]